MKYWMRVDKFHPEACALADRHYSRGKVGAPQFLPPGQTIALLLIFGPGVFGWRRPHPDRDITEANGFYGWTCTIFRNESELLSSELILDAEQAFRECGYDASELRTYIDADKIASPNPGYCFKRAGWREIGRGKDGKIVLGKTINVESAQIRMFA
jgi:hypothetical protein